MKIFDDFSYGTEESITPGRADSRNFNPANATFAELHCCDLPHRNWSSRVVSSLSLWTPPDQAAGGMTVCLLKRLSRACDWQRNGRVFTLVSCPPTDLPRLLDSRFPFSV